MARKDKATTSRIEWPEAAEPIEDTTTGQQMEKRLASMNDKVTILSDRMENQFQQLVEMNERNHKENNDLKD